MDLAEAHALYTETVRRDGEGKSIRTMLKALDLYGDTIFDWSDDLVVVWSDLHLGHEHAIGFNDRPFADVHERLG